MQSIKRNTSAILVALVMMLAMAIPAFAAEVTGTITVKGVESGVTVEAYKIVQAEYSNGEFVKYSEVKANSIADKEGFKPTAAEIKDLVAAANAGDLGTAINLTASGSDYSKSDVAAGEYLILVKGTGADSPVAVYNPMLVSVNVKGEHDGTVTAGNDQHLYGDTTAYAKKSEPSVTKKIVDSSKEDKGDTAAIGDTVKFEIGTTIPSYAGNYINPTFTVSDTVKDGLEGINTIVVKAGSDTLTDGTEYTLTNNGTNFTVAFKPDYISAHGNQAITITYNAKLGDKAVVNFDPNDNTAKVTYSNSPTTTKDSEEKTTHHYTFEINGKLSGKNPWNEKRTQEVIKVDEKGNKTVIKTSEITSETKYGDASPLPNAEFALYKQGADGHKTGDVLMTAKSDASGRLIGFKGLDAGKYVIVETKAPDGYALNETEIPAEITADIDAATGLLKSYKVTINGNASEYTASYTGTTITTIDKGTENKTTLIENKTIGTLPNTGAMGTYIFTAIGVAIIAIAAALYFSKKRKNHQSE
jgi:fimbrial isopeptide formation D2 family protein/LPXTG-motif cell wall-anchored protein